MLKKLTIMMTMSMLCGCSHHYHPLEAGKKAQLVSEIINDTPACSDFKKRLAEPSMDDDAIDAVYHEATRAQCIHKDI